MDGSYFFYISNSTVLSLFGISVAGINKTIVPDWSQIFHSGTESHMADTVNWALKIVRKSHLPERDSRSAARSSQGNAFLPISLLPTRNVQSRKVFLRLQLNPRNCSIVSSVSYSYPLGKEESCKLNDIAKNYILIPASIDFSTVKERGSKWRWLSLRYTSWILEG